MQGLDLSLDLDGDGVLQGSDLALQLRVLLLHDHLLPAEVSQAGSGVRPLLQENDVLILKVRENEELWETSKLSVNKCHCINIFLPWAVVVAAQASEWDRLKFRYRVSFSVKNSFLSVNSCWA